MPALEIGPMGRSLAATQLIVGPRPTTPIVFCDNTIWDGSPKHCTPALHCLGRNSARNESLDRLMSIAGVGAYTVGATILCALTTTASNVHAMMGMVSEALWTEPNGRTVGCIHETAHPRPGDDPRCPEGMSLWKETWRPHRAGGLLHCSARELMTIHLEEPADLLDLVGSPLGTTKWIHTDPQRAARGPFKGTVAHSFLTLSLTPMFTSEVLQIRELTMAFTYGLGQGELLCGGASRLIGASHGVGDQRAAEDIWCRIGVRPEL